MNDTLYADVIPLFTGENVLEGGIFFPAGDGKTPFVPRTEMGEAAAIVLTTQGHEYKEYAIAADTAYSFDDIAKMLSDISGKDVKYHKPDTVTYIETLVKAGIPRENASFLASFGTAIANGELDTHRSDLEGILGREPLGLKDYLTVVYGK